MRNHRILLLLAVASLAATALAGNPPSKGSSSKSTSHSTGSSHTTSSRSTSGHTSSSTSKSTGSIMHQSTGTSAGNTFKNGPHPPGSHVLGAELMAHTSLMQQHLHRNEWHRWHHWHHHWIWGSMVFLPVSHAGLVTAVPNGNTLSVMDAGNIPRRIRLAGVAAPVAGQAFFSESQQHLSALALNRHVRTFSVGVDADGTTVARVFLRDGTYLNERQLHDGMAWNLADDGFDAALGNAEQAAMAGGTGLWTQNFPIAPWLATP